MAKSEILQQLHTEVIKALLARVRSGEATAADLSLAWKLLQDNNVPLEDLRKAAGAEEADNKDFIQNLPFRAEAG